MKGQLTISTGGAISDDTWEEEREKDVPIDHEEVTSLFLFEHGLQRYTIIPHVNQAMSAHAFVERRINLGPRIVAEDVATMGLKLMDQFGNEYGYYKYPASDHPGHQRSVMAISWP